MIADIEGLGYSKRTHQHNILRHCILKIGEATKTLKELGLENVEASVLHRMQLEAINLLAATVEPQAIDEESESGQRSHEQER